jgi:hypothetical protein
MVPRTRKALSMPKLPDDMSNAAVQKRLALTKAAQAIRAKEPPVVVVPKVRIAKPR